MMMCASIAIKLISLSLFVLLYLFERQSIPTIIFANVSITVKLIYNNAMLLVFTLYNVHNGIIPTDFLDVMHNVYRCKLA